MATARSVFEEFDMRSGDIECYLERLEQYFMAMSIDITNNDTEPRRIGILLSSVGGETYKVIRDLCFPDVPKAKKYSELTDLLKKHFRPHRLVVAERFRFNTLRQQPGQSVSEFVAKLKQLASKCEFQGDALKENLRDRFVCGLLAESTQKKLLSKVYTFEQAVDLALAEESATRDVRNMGPSGKFTPAVNKVTYGFSRQTHQKKGYTQQTNRTRCDRCGLNHHRDECRHKTAKCFACGKIGHLKSECRTAKGAKHEQSGFHKNRRSHTKVRYVTEEKDDGDSDQFVDSIFTVGSVTAAPPLRVLVDIEGANVEMEVDTGAAVSVMNEKDYDKHFRHLKLEHVKRKLHAYSGTPLEVKGQILVKVDYNGQQASLPIIVIRADKYAPPLLGRDWLNIIRLDWPKLFTHGQDCNTSVNSIETSVETLKQSYSDIFGSELGTVNGVKATLHLKDDAIPIFHKPRTVPFALREAVDKELNRMEKEGVIYPVE